MKNPGLAEIAKQEMHLGFSLKAFFFGFIYLFLIIVVSNFPLVKSTIFSNFSLVYKINLIKDLFLGLFSAFSTLDVLLTILTAFFVGINSALIIQTIKRLSEKRVKVTVGGGTILAIVSTGCTSCGLSILSISGLAGAVSLPFHGVELHLLALLLLGVSFVYMLKKLSALCPVNL